MNGDKGKALYAEALAEINFWYEQLAPEDRDTVYYKPTPKAREYLDFVQHKCDELYTKIAGLCSPVERNPMQNQHENQEKETKKYSVKITEYLESVVEIEAKSPEEAEKIADENYNNCDHFLDPETYIGAEYHAEAVEKTRDVPDDRGR